MKWIVSLKPADTAGPVLVSDDPGLVRVLVDEIRRRFAPRPEPAEPTPARRRPSPDDPDAA